MFETQVPNVHTATIRLINTLELLVYVYKQHNRYFGAHEYTTYLNYSGILGTKNK